MIYGYYCIHPELVDDHYRVASRKQRLEKLTSLGAPDVILVNELRMYEEAKALYFDLSWFRNHVKKLYTDGVQNDILENYDAVFQDVGFDPEAAYSGIDVEFDANTRDYLRPLENLPDDAVLAFLSYTQGKYNEYLAKCAPKLDEIRDVFISRVKQFIEWERYPKLTSDNFTRLQQATIDIDDGFTTSLEECSGRYNTCLNQIVLPASRFDGKDAGVLFHEFFHALAGRTGSMSGFQRLAEFFDIKYGDAYDLIDETFVNAQSISLLSNNLPEWLKAIQFRDSKLELIIRRTGAHEIPREVFEDAYFSDNIDDVKLLADAIKAEFDPEELFSDLQSIKDIRTVDELVCEVDDKTERGKFFYEHRLDMIDAYFQYRRRKNYHMTDEEFLRLLKRSLAKISTDENQGQ